MNLEAVNAKSQGVPGADSRAFFGPQRGDNYCVDTQKIEIRY